jgi:hypothetical protein
MERKFDSQTLPHRLLVKWTMRALRYSFRNLLRNPAFSAVIVLLLAFGIGANTLIFTAVDVLLLRDLPVDHPEQLLRLQDIHPNGFRSYQPTFPVSYRPLLLERAKACKTFFIRRATSFRWKPQAAPKA